MCNIVNIGDKDKKIKTPKFISEKEFLEGIRSGKYNLFNLPNDLFQFNFFAIMALVSEYFGLPNDYVIGSFDFKLATNASSCICGNSGNIGLILKWCSE